MLARKGKFKKKNGKKKREEEDGKRVEEEREHWKKLTLSLHFNSSVVNNCHGKFKKITKNKTKIENCGIDKFKEIISSTIWNSGVSGVIQDLKKDQDMMADGWIWKNYSYQLHHYQHLQEIF